MLICCFAIAAAGPKLRSVPLQLQLWCSCITQPKRASTVLTGVHLTCVPCALCLGTKAGFVKACKAHEQRIFMHDFRVIRADADEGDTYINVGRFLAEWTNTNKLLRAMKVDMQFLDHHSKQYLVFRAELIRIDYSPQ